MIAKLIWSPFWYVLFVIDNLIRAHRLSREMLQKLVRKFIVYLQVIKNLLLLLWNVNPVLRIV